MTTYRFIIFTTAADGRDAEFNQWYDEVHLADVLAIPGFTSAERAIVESGDRMGPETRYAAIYELDTDDPAQVLEELHARVADGRIPMSDTLGTIERHLCRVITPRREQ